MVIVKLQTYAPSALLVLKADRSFAKNKDRKVFFNSFLSRCLLIFVIIVLYAV